MFHRNFKGIKTIDQERREINKKKHDDMALNLGSKPKRKKNSKSVDTLERTLPATYRKTDIKRLETRVCNTFKKREERYQGEMAEREQIAKEALSKKFKQIAPAYNKGPYMFITDETDPTDIGKKK